MRLWIDTDVGDNPDDAVALLCAGVHPSVEVVGVSTVYGETTWRAELVRELVDSPVVIAGDSGLVPSALAAARADALLAIGPLTNVAAALSEGTGVPPVTVMGGATLPTRHRGLVQEVEHNFGADPLAARAVLGGTTGTLVVPLDQTAAAKLDADEERGLVRAAPALEEHVDRWREENEDVPLVLHDPLALLALCEEPFVTIRSRHLLVDRDGRLVQRADAPVHRIVVKSDARAAVKRVLALLG